MKHIDEQFKDSSPVETVKKIQGILSDFGIDVTETWHDSGVSNCYTVRVSINGTAKGTNGKGVTKELARASGYAEFMERIQTGHKAPIAPDSYSDAKYMTAEELWDSCSVFYEKVAKSFNLISDKKVNAEKLLAKAFAMEGNPEKIMALPYYDVMNDKVVYLPNTFVRYVYGTNGLAAGNSINEALVQGFSEVVERYTLKMIFVDRLTPPTVPDEVLVKYETAYKTISNVRASGYDVIIKDCSVGLGYPVVASVIIDKKKHKYHIHLGSSPVFEIALERSLTEGFQGRNIDNVADVSAGFAKSNIRELQFNYNSTIRNGTGDYPAQFFMEKSSYPMIESKDFTGLGNKELLKEVFDFARRMDCSVFVRNMSHLGFDTYKIIVPEFSELYHNLSTFTTDMPYYQMYRGLEPIRKDLKNASVVDLTMLNTVIKTREVSHGFLASYSELAGVEVINRYTNKFLGNMYLAYIAWELSDTKRMLQCISKALPYVDDTFNKGYVECIPKILDLVNDGASADDAFYSLSFLYDKEIIDSLREVFTAGANPFARYIVKCTPGDCSACAVKNVCSKKIIDEISAKLSNKVKEFDAEAAQEKVISALREARSLS